MASSGPHGAAYTIWYNSEGNPQKIVDSIGMFCRAEPSTENALARDVDLARDRGFSGDYRIDIGTDVVDVAVPLCKKIAEEFPNSTFFAGQIVFRHENPFQKILHNETAFAIQRRSQYSGITTVIMPIRAEK